MNTSNPHWRDPAELTRDELITLVQSLRASLDTGTYLNDVLSSKLIGTMGVANTLGAHLYALVDSHDAGDAAAVDVYLANLSARRAQLVGVRH